MKPAAASKRKASEIEEPQTLQKLIAMMKDFKWSIKIVIKSVAKFVVSSRPGIKPQKKAKVSKAEEAKKFDVSAIKLDGESTTSVPVHDSCDEIRKKISAYLREPGFTQAAFLREIAKTYPEEKKIQSKVLNDFLSKKGATAGNTSSAYYASYVFFEKIRLGDGKPKSKHREEMEKQWASEGSVDTKTSSSRPYFCHCQ
ncbi:hypothetical protein SS1G_12940 [Sclerotinia sclerotiorum 1980 UF-70]|uniref:DUF7726 domain-containing protein n=1 Tax=Sclerotinia sclerotiorum (strain ATCC 18683 / 1980 / Ss-1) TaxID=665079 RepID=A7F5R2_SCLS1|nr:hypothetical protein SS1G_12940 [Sclerotinia sclerotiorum 1980 UF-70]EDN98083.1 hypothetical protein SS1G_12940 [Sclerotinia sclerotiorum 1980 UF-70]